LRAAGVIIHHEAKLNTTYYIYVVDERMAFVVLFEGEQRKHGNQSSIKRLSLVEFVGESLCCRNSFSMLNTPQAWEAEDEEAKRKNKAGWRWARWFRGWGRGGDDRVGVAPNHFRAPPR